MLMPTQTKLALAVAAACIALVIATVDDSIRTADRCDTDIDCLVKFCMKPGATCDGGPEPALP